jgi:quinol monooxygenase YgiN
MAKPAVHLLLGITIHEGRLNEFEGIVKDMIVGSRSEPGTVGYEWYLSSDRKHCRLLESYASAEALLAHFNGPVVQQLVPKLSQCVTIDRVEVYGEPGPEAGAMLAQFGAARFELWGGI